jgi:hypothetical protein
MLIRAPSKTIFRIAGILFSLIAAGDPWLGQSGANLVYAAESIVQRSKPGSEAEPRTVTFTGDVLKGRSFEKPIGANLFFRLVPPELGPFLSGAKPTPQIIFAALSLRRIEASMLFRSKAGIFETSIIPAPMRLDQRT